MKHWFWFFIGFSTTYAQFSALRFEEMPDSGTWQLRYYIDTTNFDPGPGGANHVWNFTNVYFLQGQDTVFWRSPAGLSGDTAFPTANLHLNHYVRLLGSSIPHNLFLRKDSGAVVILGFHQPYTNLSYLAPGLFYPEQVYVNPIPDTLFIYPFNYGESRAFPEVLQRMEVGSPPQDSFIIRRIQRQVEVDGYGSLQFFGLTYPEVVRVKVTTQLKDSSYRNSSGTWVVDYAQNGVITTYYWFAKDSGLVFVYEKTVGSIYYQGFGTFPYTDKLGYLLQTPSPITTVLPVAAEKPLFQHDPVTKTIKFSSPVREVKVVDLSGRTWIQMESEMGLHQLHYGDLSSNFYWFYVNLENGESLAFPLLKMD